MQVSPNPKIGHQKNKASEQKEQKQEFNVIPKMVMRVYQQEELFQSQFNSQTNSQNNSAQKSSADKQEQKSADQSVKKRETLLQKNTGLIDELQEIKSFQDQNYELEIIKFDEANQDINFTFNLPPKALRLIISCLLDEFRYLNIVSAKWYVGVHQTLDEWLEEVDNKFLKANMQILSIKNSFLSFTPFKVGSAQSFRLDRGIIAEVLPGLEGKCVTLGFNYTKMSGSLDRYKYEFKYDVVGKRENRTIWTLREKARHNYDEQDVTQTAQIVQVCTDDNIRISVNFFNLNGFINLDSIIWEEPLIELTPKQESKKKSSRGCYLEKQYDDWILYEYFANVPHKIKLDNMAPHLVLQEARCAGIDTVINRMVYVTDQRGLILESEMGIPITVVGAKEEVTVEIKKLGLIADLQLPLVLRKGDILIFYLTKGD